jgi:predicted membrane channel-forming protein YqfA (hemolysin III family)
LIFILSLHQCSELAQDWQTNSSHLQITSIGVATSIVVLFPQFRTPAWRPFRAFMFVAMGLSAVVPVLHGIQMFGVEQLDRQMGLFWVVTQGFLYILGAGIYAVSGLQLSTAGMLAED